MSKIGRMRTAELGLPKPIFWTSGSWFFVVKTAEEELKIFFRKKTVENFFYLPSRSQ